MSLLDVAKLIYDFLGKLKEFLNAFNITFLDEAITNAMEALK